MSRLEDLMLLYARAAAEKAADSGEPLDVYRLADEFLATHPSHGLPRRRAADLLIAAAAVHSAPALIDPD
jgi:hypothetical protein